MVPSDRAELVVDTLESIKDGDTWGRGSNSAATSGAFLERTLGALTEELRARLTEELRARTLDALLRLRFAFVAALSVLVIF